MKNTNRFRGLMLFLAGLLTAVVLQSGFQGQKKALADQYWCIRQDLDAQGMTGNIPDPEFTITYVVPSCYESNGYKVDRVYMYGAQVAVHYKSVNPASSVLNGLPGSSGGGSGFSPIP